MYFGRQVTEHSCSVWVADGEVVGGKSSEFSQVGELGSGHDHRSCA
jgi:hypothetical protein